MKILICHNYYHQYGGEDAAVEALMKLLKNNGHIVKLFSRKSQPQQNLNILSKFNIGINSIYSKQIQNQLSKCLDEFQPDVVHIHNIFPLISASIYKVLREGKFITVQTIHNFRWFCPNGLFFTQGKICSRCSKGNTLHAVRYRCLHGSITQSISYSLSIGFARLANLFPLTWGKIIVLNQFTADLFLSNFHNHLRNVVVLGNFLEDITGETESDPKKRFIYMGRLSPEKGVEILLEAAKNLPDVNFDIIGTGPLENELKEIARNRNLTNIHFWGFIQGNLRFKFLKDANALIVPSLWYEQFPMTILEAYRLGVPVVASHLGGLPDIVKDNSTGCLFSPGNSNELEEKLRRLITDLKFQKQLSINARNQFIQEHSAKAFYPKLLAIYT